MLKVHQPLHRHCHQSVDRACVNLFALVECQLDLPFADHRREQHSNPFWFYPEESVFLDRLRDAHGDRFDQLVSVDHLTGRFLVQRVENALRVRGIAGPDAIIRIDKFQSAEHGFRLAGGIAGGDHADRFTGGTLATLFGHR